MIHTVTIKVKIDPKGYPGVRDDPAGAVHLVAEMLTVTTYVLDEVDVECMGARRGWTHGGTVQRPSSEEGKGSVFVQVHPDGKRWMVLRELAAFKDEESAAAYVESVIFPCRRPALTSTEREPGFYWIQRVKGIRVEEIAYWLGGEWHFNGTDEAKTDADLPDLCVLDGPIRWGR